MMIFVKVYRLLEEHGPMTFQEMRDRFEGFEDKRALDSVNRAMKLGESRGYIQIFKNDDDVRTFAVTSKPYLGRDTQYRPCVAHLPDGDRHFSNINECAKFLNASPTHVMKCLNLGHHVFGVKVSG